MSRYTDLWIEQDDEGVFDFVVENGDLKTTDGLDSAVVVSLFSDRRAYREEVADPMKRRGWIGDLVSDVASDRHGSGLWLYEQHRLTQATAVGVRNEAVQAFDWAVDENLIERAEADVLKHPAERRITLNVTLHMLDGGKTSRAFVLADATRTGLLARL